MRENENFYKQINSKITKLTKMKNVLNKYQEEVRQ